MSDRPIDGIFLAGVHLEVEYLDVRVSRFQLLACLLERAGPNVTQGQLANAIVGESVRGLLADA